MIRIGANTRFAVEVGKAPALVIEVEGLTLRLIGCSGRAAGIVASQLFRSAGRYRDATYAIVREEEAIR